MTTAPNVLTPPIRAYLRRLDRQILFVDIIRDLTQDFGLSDEQAGAALAQMVKEDIYGADSAG